MLIRELDAGAHNFTVLVAEVVSRGGLELPLPGDADDAGDPLEKYEQPAAGAADDDYQRIMADVWVGAVLTLLIFSCICCVCSCLLYHKFRQWKTRGHLQKPFTHVAGVGTSGLSRLQADGNCPGVPTPATWVNAMASEDDLQKAVQARGLAEAATAVGRAGSLGNPGSSPAAGELESLPSYTLVSGLPSYDEALDQLRRSRLELAPPDQPAKLSAQELFATYKVYQVS